MRNQLARRQNELNAQLIAIDPHEKWSAKYLLREVGLDTDAVNFPLLADPAQIVSATYGVAFQMRIHIEHSNRPATFIIDKQGVLRFAKPGKSYGDRPMPGHITQELKRIR